VRTPILGIDPGPEQSGWAIYEGQDGDSRTPIVSGVSANEDLLSIIVEHAYSHLAIEKIASYGMAVGADIFETCFQSGRMAQAYYEAGGMFDLIRVTRQEVKLHLCHDSRAKDANIRQALIDKLGPPGIKSSPGPTYRVKSHAWAALAVAVTAAETRINA